MYGRFQWLSNLVNHKNKTPGLRPGLEQEYQGLLPTNAASNQASQTDQSAAQQSDGAGFRNFRPRAISCESCLWSAIRAGSRAEVDHNARKLARVQASGGQCEGHGVDTHNSMWCTFDVGLVEGKGAELADVLIRLETFETQSRISVYTGESGDSTGAARNQSRRSVECDVTALQFERVTSVHVDGNRYLIQSRVSYEYSTNVGDAREVGIAQGKTSGRS